MTTKIKPRPTPNTTPMMSPSLLESDLFAMAAAVVDVVVVRREVKGTVVVVEVVKVVEAVEVVVDRVVNWIHAPCKQTPGRLLIEQDVPSSSPAPEKH